MERILVRVQVFVVLVTGFTDRYTLLLMVISRQELLDPPLEFATRHHDLVVAGQAADTDVGANAYDTPGVAATRVGFAHLSNIANMKF